MAKKLPPVLANIPKYNGAAVYALIDEQGKRYIGSTSNLGSRLKTHSFGIRQALAEGVATWLPLSLVNAVTQGHTFRVEVLRSFPEGASQEDLRREERSWILAAGGCACTYNSQNINQDEAATE